MKQNHNSVFSSTTVNICILVGLILSISSCDDSIQYDVWVANKTQSDIHVQFKSSNDVSGVVDSSLILTAGENRRIISTIDLEKKNSDPCQQVAEYVKVRNSEAKWAKEKWCTQNIAYVVTDIGQAEYHLTYTPKDFN